MLVLCIGAALTGGLSAFVAAAASASSTHATAMTMPGPPTTPTPPTPPPPTTPTTTTTTTTTTTSSGTTTTPYCTFADLSLKYIDTQGATSHRYVDYAFENVSKTACRLRGYPRIVLLNKSGHAIHHSWAKVTHDPVSPIRTVVIKPGKRGYFTFTWVTGTACPGHFFTFYALRAYPPHDFKNFERHPGKTSPCNKSAKVTAVRPKRLKF